MTAKIYRPARNAMQSGKAKTKQWLLDYEPEGPRVVEPLMGWTASMDMKSQIRLSFDTMEQAVAYAEKHGVPYRVLPPREPAVKALSYSENFKASRRGLWTH